MGDRVISRDNPPIIYVTREECDRWHEDAELRTECLRLAAGCVAMVCTTGGYLVATILRAVCNGCCGSGMASTFAEHEHTCRSCNGAGFRMDWS